MAEALRVGVIGVGVMGSHHARVYDELPGAQLVAVADADETRLAGDRWGAGVLHGCSRPLWLPELLIKRSGSRQQRLRTSGASDSPAPAPPLTSVQTIDRKLRALPMAHVTRLAEVGRRVHVGVRRSR